jgi:hypothetical protein
MAILPLHGVHKNLSLGSDTPPKRDASPLYLKARQVKRQSYACVIAGQEWSIDYDPCGKKGHTHIPL